MTARRFTSLFASALLLIGGALAAVVHPSFAAQLTDRSIALSTSRASATNVTYTISFGISSVYSMGSMVFEFCEEDPLPNQPCTSPSGMDLTAATIASQSGETGFSVHPNTTANRIVLSRAASPTVPGTNNYAVANVRNADLANHTFYARLYTFASSDGTGPHIDDGGVALALANEVAFNTEVPPYLLFCLAQSISGFDCLTATGNFLDFGEFSNTRSKTVQSQMVIATNAGYGAGITMSGITLTSGNNVIANVPVPSVAAPGTPQFGMNLRANSSPSTGQDPAGPGSMSPTANYNIPNRFTFNNGDVVATTATVSDVKKLTATYIANVPSSQPPGIYNTTLTYIALANF